MVTSDLFETTPPAQQVRTAVTFAPEVTTVPAEQFEFDEVLRNANAKRSQRKPVEVVHMFNKKGEINFLLKKAWLLLHDYSLQQGLLQDPEKRRFRVLLRQLCRDIAFDSNNHEHLKRTLTGAIETSVSWGPSARSKKGERSEWEATALLADCKFVVVSGHLYIDWSYSDVLLAQLRREGAYFRLALSAVRKARSLSALNLYLLCERFRTNHNGLSHKYTPIEAYEALSGNELKTDAERARFQYKYFKRDTLGPAVAEVNSYEAGLKVEVREVKVGRSITWVQFMVREDNKQLLSSGIKVAIEARLVRLGISDEVARDACRFNSVEALEAATQRLEERLSKPPAVVNTEAYFRTVLDLARKGEISTSTDSLPSVEAPPTGRGNGQTYSEVLESVKASYMTSPEAAKAYFKSLPTDEREELLDRFKVEVVDGSSNASLMKLFATKRAAPALVAVYLYPWILKRGFTYEPVELEVMQYGVSAGLLKTGVDPRSQA
jgi:hypothetical protein